MVDILSSQKLQKELLKASAHPKSSVPLVFSKSQKVKEHWENKFNIKGSVASVYIEDDMEVWPIVDMSKESFNKNDFFIKSDLGYSVK